MGSKLTVLAVQLIAFAAAPAAHAEPTAAELAKQGIEAYKANQYDAAILKLSRSYDLDPKPETLFALAQAERLAGHCDRAVPHYRELLASMSDLAAARLVQNSLALCGQDEPKPPPAPASPAGATPAPAPKVIVREVRRGDALATTLLAGGMLVLGGGAGLYLSSRASFDAADDAGTLQAHDDLDARGRRDRTLAIVAGGAGVAMIGVAIYRLAAGKPRSTEVSVAPISGGTLMYVSSRW